ncbi:MAG: ECF transporter S component [Chloroflexota bacterium]|nr:ECF transporter S component [Chloroflexota bacterium]
MQKNSRRQQAGPHWGGPLPARLATLVALALLLLALPGSAGAQEAFPHHAGLVIDFGDGAVYSACVDLGPDGEATGEEVLQASGFDLLIEYSPMGGAVCRIDQQGCDFPGQPCWCECMSSPCVYWAYNHLVDGQWVYSSVGASVFTVQTGGVEGWAWGEGSISVGAAPALISFDDICEAPTATTTPSATQSPTPTATSTSVPTETPTATATQRPTSTWTPEPNNTPLPTTTWTATPTSAWTPLPADTPLSQAVTIDTATPVPTATWTASPTPLPTEPLPPSPTATAVDQLIAAVPAGLAPPGSGDQRRIVNAGNRIERTFLPLLAYSRPIDNPAPAVIPPAPLSAALSPRVPSTQIEGNVSEPAPQAQASGKVVVRQDDLTLVKFSREPARLLRLEPSETQGHALAHAQSSQTRAAVDFSATLLMVAGLALISIVIRWIGRGRPLRPHPTIRTSIPVGKWQGSLSTGAKTSQTISLIIYGLAAAIGVLALISPFLGTAIEATGITAGPTGNGPLLLMLLIGLAFTALLLDIQSQAVTSKTMALLGVLVAINAVLRFVEVGIPGPGGFSPVFFLIIMTGYVFGGRFGFLMGSLTILVSALITGGVGPWLPGQIFAAGWVGLTAPLMRPVVRVVGGQPGSWREVVALAVFGGLWGLLFGLIMNLWFWPFMAGPADQYYQAGLDLSSTIQRYLTFYLTTSLIWDLLRLAGNALLILVFGAATLRALRRFQLRFDFDYQPIPEDEFAGINRPVGGAAPAPLMSWQGREGTL